MNNVNVASLTRRQVLLLASGSILLTGCSPGAARKAAPVKHTVTDLLADAPFYIAHRGSMDNWPEHTAEAYSQSLAYGSKAIEISVSATSDGQLVCHHDLNTLRMTGKSLTIADAPYSALADLQNDARLWLGPNSLLLPIPLLKDVLDAGAKDHVVFIEDKQGTNTAALLDLMDTYPDATDHFVWKQSAMAEHHLEAAARGYTTWGYFTEDDFKSVEGSALNGIASDFDLLGIYHTATDQIIKKLVNTGKPVICWEVHTRWMRDRLKTLGVRGIMCANIPYVTTETARSKTDGFATGIRGFGDLPWALAWTHQPTILPQMSSISLDHGDKSSYCMGSMCPITADNYSLEFEMRWPESGPRNLDHAGVAFGQRDDSPYRIQEPGAVGGYHVVLRSDGGLELFGRQSGSEYGYSLGAAATEPPVNGVWMRFRIEITPTTIRCSRLDGKGATISANSDVYRGGYFSLNRNYYDFPPVEFRGITVV
ncbi:hypothetical protein IV500_02690 [Paeniglutamicibacter antarcticus]|uniref:GP-PDE domain-containing protein n=1 Tax=Arthrobacter terrae TaxID=2935737 RepID=A0A931CRK4_9MICC|nr:glycerophosphodiester phosphodiesterase family protein [Arthrobacter terrae]MBG0738338.1 hypothetical protein [Arthrobacter terrae]